MNFTRSFRSFSRERNVFSVTKKSASKVDGLAIPSFSFYHLPRVFPRSLTPMKVPFLGDKKIIKVQAGESCSAASTADGKVIVWGIWLTTRDREQLFNMLYFTGPDHDEEVRRSLPVVPRIIDIKQQVVDISLCGELLLALTIG